MFTLLTFFFIYLLHLTNSLSYLEEERLRNDIFLNYNKDIRPVLNLKDPIEIEGTLIVFSVYDLKLDTGHLITRSSLGIKWKDEHLNWKPNKYGNITKIYINSEQVWMPRIFVCNSEEEANQNSENKYELVLNSDGKVEFWQAKILRTFCDVNVYSYPFDSQACDIWLCVEVHEEIHTRFKSLEYTMYPLIPNYHWDIKMEGFNLGLNKTYINATMYLSRKLKISSVAMILPAGMLSILSLCVFLLPPETGEKVSLAITVFLTNVVYLVEMDGMLSGNSQYPALIILYLIALTSVSGLAAIGAIIVCRIQVLNERQSESNNDCMRFANNKVEPINTIDLEYKPMSDPKDPPGGSKIITKKRITCCGHGRLDNILFGISCVMFFIFALVFGLYFNKH